MNWKNVKLPLNPFHVIVAFAGISILTPLWHFCAFLQAFLTYRWIRKILWNELYSFVSTGRCFFHSELLCSNRNTEPQRCRLKKHQYQSNNENTFGKGVLHFNAALNKFRTQIYLHVDQRRRWTSSEFCIILKRSSFCFAFAVTICLFKRLWNCSLFEKCKKEGSLHYVLIFLTDKIVPRWRETKLLAHRTLNGKRLASFRQTFFLQT